jgi:hypothetical protein
MIDCIVRVVTAHTSLTVAIDIRGLTIPFTDLDAVQTDRINTEALSGQTQIGTGFAVIVPANQPQLPGDMNAHTFAHQLNNCLCTRSPDRHRQPKTTAILE